MRIEALRHYRGRNPNGAFEDLPPDLRRRAWHRLWYMEERRRKQGKQTPPWTRALLFGQAKRLTLNPPTSAWGRSMLAKRGGVAVQKKYRAEGRDPTAKATQTRVTKLRVQKQIKVRREAEEQARRAVQAACNASRWMLR